MRRTKAINFFRARSSDTSDKRVPWQLPPERSLSALGTHGATWAEGAQTERRPFEAALSSLENPSPWSGRSAPPRCASSTRPSAQASSSHARWQIRECCDSASQWPWQPQRVGV